MSWKIHLFLNSSHVTVFQSLTLKTLREALKPDVLPIWGDGVMVNGRLGENNLAKSGRRYAARVLTV